MGRAASKSLTEPALREAALDYLGRFAASKQRLRQVLTRRIRKNALQSGIEPAPLLAALDSVIAALEKQGLVNDAAFAALKAGNLTRRGAGRRQVQAKLAAFGVDAPTRAGALAGLARDFDDPELAAAMAYAKRRRLGPYRAGPADDARLKKDLAAMARAGFSFALAKRVLKAEAIETEDE